MNRGVEERNIIGVLGIIIRQRNECALEGRKQIRIGDIPFTCVAIIMVTAT